MELEVDLEFQASVFLFTALAILVAAAVFLRRYKAPSVASSAAVSSSSPAAGADDEPPSRLLADQHQAVPEPKVVSENEPEGVKESQPCTGTVSATEDNLPEAVCSSEPVIELVCVPEALAMPDPLFEPPTKLKDSEPLPVNEFPSVKEAVSEPQPDLAAHLGPEAVPVQESNTQLEPVLEPPSTPETAPPLKPVCESLLAPETVTELQPVLESLSIPEPVLETVTQPEPVLKSLSEPVPETFTQPESALESLLAPEPVLETVTQPGPVRAVPELATQLKSAIETCSVLEQISKSTVKPALDQPADAEPSSEPDPEAATLVSEPVSVTQVTPEAEPFLEPVSELKSVVQSESEPNEVLQIVAEPVLVHLDKSVSAPLPRSDQEKCPSSEPVAEQAVNAVPKAEPQAEPALNGEAAAAEDRVTFTPGKKANKFETLMTKEELEEEQRLASRSSN
ncbi:uncharacterized protein LOC144043808 isoform X2 [Vanacampus margaritifer]